MKPRYKGRLRLQGQVVFTNGAQTGEGRLVDLTSPGCLIESAGIAVPKGQSLQLTISLHGHTQPLKVALAVVRWMNGNQFGVEFIKMEESHRLALNQIMARHVPDLTPNTMKKTFSEPGGRNWHLETYSMRKPR